MDCRFYHPNIDLDGNVCLNILREDWKPPCWTSTRLSMRAAELFRNEPEAVCRSVNRSFGGYSVQGIELSS
ncbi:Ubiquitin-conjugating enzyme, active site [Phytophthora cactorum]|nr:Ubiquitin-conjugating enzyme, active site [Phytophthora cactorum]